MVTRSSKRTKKEEEEEEVTEEQPEEEEEENAKEDEKEKAEEEKEGDDDAEDEEKSGGDKDDEEGEKKDEGDDDKDGKDEEDSKEEEKEKDGDSDEKKKEGDSKEAKDGDDDDKKLEVTTELGEEMISPNADFVSQPSPHVREQMAFISKSTPKSKLEVALSGEVARKEAHIARLTAEVGKLKKFISKRKQTYKRKRKDSGAPTRALSAYNIFVQDRFKRLSKENEVALKSADTDAQLKRVPPSNLVAATGGQWKLLSAEEKAYYGKRAQEDRKRYEEQMATYQAPEKRGHSKRNKTGYNMFFSAHVNHLKQSEAGVPSERGSVARLVGSAWKQLTADEKQFYEKEADRHNEINPPDKPVDGGDGSPASKKSRGVKAQEPPSYHVPTMGRGSAPVIHQPQSQGEQGGPPPGQDQWGAQGGWGYPPQGGYGDPNAMYAPQYGHPHPHGQYAPPPPQAYGAYQGYYGQDPGHSQGV